MERLRVAAVQAAPVWMDREATLAKVCRRIAEAARGGARVVAFSETFVPGYPWWTSSDRLDLANLDVVTARQAIYLRNGVDVARGDLAPVVEAARAAGCFVALGIAERSATGGSLYCSLVLIDPERGIVGVHRKLKPTYTERVAWADGDAHGLRVHEWAGWRIGGLNCWENWLPLPKYALYAQGEQLHVATWPGGRGITTDASRLVAIEGGVFVVSVSGLFDASLVPDDFPGARALRESLDGIALGDGGTLIVDPNGVVLAEAAPKTEEIVYADLDLGVALAARTLRDQGGHYHRPDLLELRIDGRRLG
ncbi:MAG: carbon-nitrogen hydrolase family protein [Myxococcota bacterium]